MSSRALTWDDRRRRKYRDYDVPARMPKPPAANDGINPRDTTPLTIEESRDLSALARAGNVCARDRMVASCEGMLILWVRRYVRRGAPSHLYDDLLSECRLAVVQSVSVYDPERGMKFSSYAMFRVRNVCFETMRSMRWAVNLPILRNPEKAKEFGGRVRTRSTTSVLPSGDEIEMEFPSLDPDPDFLEHELLRKLVQTVLSDRERDIIESHWQRDETLESIGVRHQVSRERIRQIEESALNKLRAHLKRNPGFNKTGNRR